MPNIVTPLCRCAREPETVDHVILRCLEHENARGTLRQSLIQRGQPLHTRRDLADASANPDTARTVVRWLLRTGRLPQFDLAEQLVEAQGEIIYREGCKGPIQVAEGEGEGGDRGRNGVTDPVGENRSQ